MNLFYKKTTCLQCNLHCALSERVRTFGQVVFLSGCVWLLGSPHETPHCFWSVSHGVVSIWEQNLAGSCQDCTAGEEALAIHIFPKFSILHLRHETARYRTKLGHRLRTWRVFFVNLWTQKILQKLSVVCRCYSGPQRHSVAERLSNGSCKDGERKVTETGIFPWFFRGRGKVKHGYFCFMLVTRAWWTYTDRARPQQPSFDIAKSSLSLERTDHVISTARVTLNRSPKQANFLQKFYGHSLVIE